MAIAKICGLTTPEGLEAALAGGAAYVGFNFFPASPRYLGIGDAAALAARAGPAKVVAVTVDPDDALIAELRAKLAPDFIQLHGAETPARVAEVARLSGSGVIKAIAVAHPDDLDSAAGYQSVADLLMFDARAPAGSGRPGGHGARFDWAMLSGRVFERPWFLAGGLDPDNVAAAVAASGAKMVDVSSGVEGAGGLKDPALIGRFLAAAQAA